jgi:hypothetical protein
LEFFYGVEDVVAEGLRHAVDELVHLQLSVELAVDVEVEIKVLEEREVLRREALFEVGNEVGVRQILAHVNIPLDH